MENLKKHITLCFGLIEQKLERGSLTSWNTDDFRILSESIQKETATLLSVSTLKRLSGKVNYSSKPNSTTLNALATYVGFKDWRAFTNDLNLEEPREQEPSNKKKWVRYGIPFLILTIGLAVFLLYSQREKAYDPDDFVFDSRPVSTGIPNSVVFDYDASAAADDSKIEIQQYWDEAKRMTIDKTDSIATSIYYHPGFFKSKLVIDDSIVKENDVFIPTQDWLGIIEQEPHPIYLAKSEILKDGRMSITPETVASYDLDPKTSNVVVSFYQVKDFGELYTDNFEMRISLKNDFVKVLSGCQAAQVLILYDGGAISIPMAKKGCASELTVMTFDEFIDGKKNDLSGFGVNPNEFVELKCNSKNGKLEITINEKFVYKMRVPKTAMKIKGIVIQFEGAGSVQNVVFKKNEKVVYSTNFNTQ